MSKRNEELEAKLMAKAQEAIQDLIAKQKPKSEITLSDMERNVSELSETLRQDIMQELANQASETAPESVSCPICECVMRYKGRKSKRMVTLSGEIEINREYYYCEACRRGYFPPR